MRWLTRVALASLLILPPVPLFPQFGSVTRQLGTFATVEVPRKARLDAPGNALNERGTGVGWRLNRFHTWAMGSSTPYRASLFINLHAPSATDASYDEALHYVERDLNGGADDWKQVVKDAQWDIIQGRYTVNLLNEPTWRMKYRDPSRRISALWQVHQKDWKLEDARAALVKMVASVTRTAEIVELRTDPERRIALYKSIAAKPDANALPKYVSWGWRTHGGSEWEDHMPNDDYYPSPGTRAYLDGTLSKPGPHYFLIRTIRLDVTDEADFHIADWFEYASKQR